MRAFAAAIALVLLAGCRTASTGPAVPPAVAPTGPETAAQIVALEKQAAELKVANEASAKLAAAAAGAVYGAQHANQGNPDGLPKEAVASNLEEAASALPEVPAEEKLRRERDNARILAGELAAVKAERGQAISENQTLKATLALSQGRIAELETEVAATKASAEKERAEAAAKLRRQFDDLTAQVNAARAEAQQAADEARKSAQAKLGWVLLGLGGLLTLAGAAIAFVSKGLEWQRAGIAVASGALCFALYWTLNQPWFKWLVWGSVAFGLASGAWWLLRERTLATRYKDADESEDTLKRIIEVIDEVGESATIKEVRARMSAKMDTANKALVHELRAESKRSMR